MQDRETVFFGTHSYRHDSASLSSQRCINAYVEQQPRDARTAVAVIGSPGLDEFANVGTGPIRGGLQMNDVAYFVSGSELWEVDANGDGVLRGTGITGLNPISMDGNGFEIVITNGLAGFSYLLADQTFQQITDPDFEIGNTVVVINSLFAFDWAGTNKFTLSDILDGRSYSGDFASAESNPDFVKAVRNRNGVLLVFGAKTIEPWDHTGATDFPFSRSRGNTVDRGIAAPLAITSANQAEWFLGNDMVFYQMAGLSLRRVSTSALEIEWRKYASTSDAYCFPASINGHVFVHLVFPLESKCFAYDLTTDRWHERMSFDPAGGEIKWRGSCAIECYGKTLVGDSLSGRIGVFDPQSYTDFGAPLVTKLVSAPIWHNNRNIGIPLLEVDLETGVGLTSGQGSDPQLMLEISTDGGKTWHSEQLWSTIGKKGEYDMLTVGYDRLGTARHWTFRLTISDPVKRVFHGARTPGRELGVQ